MNNKPLENIKQIHEIMERSTIFISLSGISGVWIGIIAFITFGIASLKSGSIFFNDSIMLQIQQSANLKLFYALLFALSLISAISIATFLSYRKAVKNGFRKLDSVSRRFILNFLIPLLTGALFIFAFIINNAYAFILPSMLIFYGLALLNSGKFSRSEIISLGTSEIALGSISLFLPELAPIFWLIGFGIINMIYGTILHRRYN